MMRQQAIAMLFSVSAFNAFSAEHKRAPAPAPAPARVESVRILKNGSKYILKAFEQHCVRFVGEAESKEAGLAVRPIGSEALGSLVRTKQVQFEFTETARGLWQIKVPNGQFLSIKAGETLSLHTVPSAEEATLWDAQITSDGLFGLRANEKYLSANLDSKFLDLKDTLSGWEAFSLFEAPLELKVPAVSPAKTARVSMAFPNLNVSGGAHAIKGLNKAHPSRYLETKPALADLGPVFYAGLFDGVNGPHSSYWAAANMHASLIGAVNRGGLNAASISQAAMVADQRLLRTLAATDESGTSAIFALIAGNDLYIANGGDSRAVLAKTEDLGESSTAVRLTQDHRFDENMGEMERVRVLGVQYQLEVTRALGHKKHKSATSGLTAKPEVFHLAIDSTYQFLILMDRGVTSVLSDQQAVEFVANLRKEGVKDPRTLSAELAQFALESFSMDNIGVTVVLFDHK